MNGDGALPLLGRTRKVRSYVQHGENDNRSSEKKKSLEGICSLIIAGRDAPEIFQATETAFYDVSSFISLSVLFPWMKQIFGRRNRVPDALLHRFLEPRLACSDTLLVIEPIFYCGGTAFHEVERDRKKVEDSMAEALTYCDFPSAHFTVGIRLFFHGSPMIKVPALERFVLDDERRGAK